jgi:V/A-type H+-transporting ATPase subunit C
MALKSHLLTPEDYYFLLRTRALDEFLGYLTTTAYGPLLSGWDWHGPEAEKDFSRRLYGDLAQAYLKVQRGLQARERRFIGILARRLVAENLKVVLRALHHKLPPDHAATLLSPLDGLTPLDFGELLRQGSIQGLTDFLAPTPWGPPLARGLPRYLKEGNLFPLEMSLDLWVFQGIRQGVEDLSGADRRLAGAMFAILADITNIDWLVRFKELYGFSGEEIYQYLLEAGRFQKPRDRRRLAFAPDLEALVAELPPQPYGKMLSGAGKVAEVERRLQDFWLKSLTRVLSLPLFQIGLPVAYLFLKELEVTDLITMMTGLRLKLTAERIHPYLHGKAAGQTHV